MEKAYKNLVVLFLFISVIIVIGFYNTYFGLFPRFEGLTPVVHYHAIALILWSVLLIVQPLLIRFKKMHIHRILGKCSYGLALIIVITTLALARHMYYEREGQMTVAENLSKLFLPLSHMALFSLFYGLSIINKKTAALHMRYMIAASFVVLAPAIARFNFAWTGHEVDPLLISYVFTEMLLLCFILFDRYHQKKYLPYLIALCCYAVVHVASYHGTETWLWQGIAGQFVDVFF